MSDLSVDPVDPVGPVGPTGDYVDVGHEDDLRRQGCTLVEAHGMEILVAHIGGEWFATDAVCTHSFAYLTDGGLEGYEIVCPLHLARFDVRDGRPTRRPAREPLRTCPVTVAGGAVLVGPPRT